MIILMPISNSEWFATCNDIAPAWTSSVVMVCGVWCIGLVVVVVAVFLGFVGAVIVRVVECSVVCGFCGLWIL